MCGILCLFFFQKRRGYTKLNITEFTHEHFCLVVGTLYSRPSLEFMLGKKIKPGRNLKSIFFLKLEANGRS